ncbi:MAG: hypothetical protein U5L45_18430 [Saprospiraceae bacterium]|nr:hypothetical protein [Saprospiraceae bacterium]
MTPLVFQTYWDKNFQDCPPINHVFKLRFTESWFRIHSLPDAKRYATTDAERLEILHRQNTLLHELADDIGTRIFLVTGGYAFKDNASDTFPAHKSLDKYAFQDLELLDLNAVLPDYYDEDIVYRPAFAATEWQNKGEFNDLLTAIADDELRVFFILPAGKILFAPYDGGVDIVVFDDEKRAFLKKKFADWLPKREDGL